jgi:AGCS family alanine or glycine:cation symporter
MLQAINDFIWGPIMLCFFLGTGGYLMLRMRFLPIRRLGYALRCAFGKDARNKDTRSKDAGSRGIGNKEARNEHLRSTESGKSGDISPFSSLMTELAATIGTGNIAGVATAMILGGPGALVWMLISSFLGLSTKFAESMLSVKYRTYNAKGEVCGGPMYTLERAFPNRILGRCLGISFAFFAVFASFGMGNMAQANSISEALWHTFRIPKVQTGFWICILTILVVLGGIRAIAKVANIMVPAMGIFYLLGAGLVIFYHLDHLPSGLMMIITMAFSPKALAGGVGGNLIASMNQAMRWGVARGVFSNEAGLGATGISAAAARTADPVRQGYISMTGVFFDTMVICTVTGLMLAASGVLGTRDASGELLTGTALAIAAFQTTFGTFGARLLTAAITLFAYATIIAWAYQGEKAFEYLTGKPKYNIAYRFFYGFAAFLGAVQTLELVWSFSDIMNALMAIPNLICVLALSGTVCREIRGVPSGQSPKSRSWH